MLERVGEKLMKGKPERQSLLRREFDRGSGMDFYAILAEPRKRGRLKQDRFEGYALPMIARGLRLCLGKRG
jgi:hypothetical protein